MTRAENWARFKEDLADLKKREDGCQHCQKARRISDIGKIHFPRQCWAHMDERQALALSSMPR